MSAFHPRIVDAVRGYGREQFRRDALAGLNVATIAFPLSIAFAIAAGVGPGAGLVTAIVGGVLVALFGGSKVQIGGPTGAFVIITSGILAAHGPVGLYFCTGLAGFMLMIMGFARFGSIIRFIPYPVSRAFTKGIALLILSSQIKNFFGLHGVEMPLSLVGKLQALAAHVEAIHLPTTLLAVACVAALLLWPQRWSRVLPGAMGVLVLGSIVAAALGLPGHFGVTTIGSEFGGLTASLRLQPFILPPLDTMTELIQPAFTIALLVAMQALLCAVVTDGLVDDRHDSNQELIGQGIANALIPFFAGLPVTGAVARSVLNARSGARTPVAALVQCGILMVLVVVAAPLLSYVPLACLSAVLVVAACRMVSWKQLLRLSRWPRSDSSVFGATFLLTVFANLTLAVEVGVVLAALLTVKRVAETSQITAVDESNETEGVHNSLVGHVVPDGVLVFRVFGAFFFGVVDKLDDELKRAVREPDVLILRIEKVLAIDATGLQALEDLHAKLSAKGKHLIVSGPHTQPLSAMFNAGFVDRLGAENLCADIVASLARARNILGLAPEQEPLDAAAHAERVHEVAERARREFEATVEQGLGRRRVD